MTSETAVQAFKSSYKAILYLQESVYSPQLQFWLLLQNTLPKTETLAVLEMLLTLRSYESDLSKKYCLSLILGTCGRRKISF